MALNPDVARLLQSPIMDPAQKSNGQVLTWDASLGKWIAKNSSGGASSLAGLDDVGIENPTDGQVIVYDSTSQKWINADAPTGGGLTVIDMADYVTDGHINPYEPTTVTNPGLIAALSAAKSAGKPIVVKNVDLGTLLDPSDPTTWESELVIDPQVVQIFEYGGGMLDVTLCVSGEIEYSFIVYETLGPDVEEVISVSQIDLRNLGLFSFPAGFDLTTGGDISSQFWRVLGLMSDRIVTLSNLKITSDGTPITVLANFTITTLNPATSRAGQFSFVYDGKIYIADWHANSQSAQNGTTITLNRII